MIETYGSSPGINQRPAAVYGHSALFRPACWWLRVLGWTTDVGVLFSLAWLIIRSTGWAPFPDFRFLLLFLPSALLLQMSQMSLLGGTFGSRTWRLRRLTEERKPPRAPSSWSRTRLVQLESLTFDHSWEGILITSASIFLSTYFLRTVVLSHPIWSVAEETHFKPFVPASGSAEGWKFAAFYYTLGVWPTRFEGQPILHSLPYEKGPPQLFVGHITARWENPDIQLTFRGPLTVLSSVTPLQIKQCLTQVVSLIRPSCLAVRRTLLDKHLDDIRSKLGEGARYEVDWFQVDNPALTENEYPRGFRIRAKTDSRIQDRWVLTLPKGPEQTITLDYLPGKKGELASEVLTQAIRSQKVSSDIGVGRAWADQELLSIRLNELHEIQDQALWVTRLAEIQAVLLSKISVDPKGYDAYYHLGGTSFLLARQGARVGNLDWASAAKPLLRSAWRYANDLAPEDNRTRSLQSLWLELSK